MRPHHQAASGPPAGAHYLPWAGGHFLHPQPPLAGQFQRVGGGRQGPSAAARPPLIRSCVEQLHRRSSQGCGRLAVHKEDRRSAFGLGHRHRLLPAAGEDGQKLRPAGCPAPGPTLMPVSVVEAAVPGGQGHPGAGQSGGSLPPWGRNRSAPPGPPPGPGRARPAGRRASRRA